MAKNKPTRKFIKERRRNACPACLDRNALTITGHKVPEAPVRVYNKSFAGPCEVCEGKGYVHEVNVVGMEWRRYPWVIVG